MADSAERIGKYEIVERIGRGGMGTVFKARDTRLNRHVALKVISPDIEITDDLRTRFISEAQACAGLRHPNIVTIYDVGEEGDRVFIVMELLDGQELKRLIADRVDLDVEDKVSVMIQLCDALHYAHTQGIIHRDIKPGNVVVQRDGSVKVIDFGIAKMAQSANATRTGLIMGTIRYMSPEQVRGRADARSDQYSLGAVFYEMLALRPPFLGDDPIALLEQLRTEKVPHLRELDPAIPEDLATIVERAIQRDAADRFADLDEMKIELDEVRRRLRNEADTLRRRIGPRFAELRQLQSEYGRRVGVDLTQELTPNAERTMGLGSLQRWDREIDGRVEDLRRKIERAGALEAEVARAAESLRASRYADAIAACEAVLAELPEHAEAARILAEARELDERQRRQALAHELIGDARAALADGEVDLCCSILEQVAEIPPPAELSPTIEALRASADAKREELARLRREAEQTAEQAASVRLRAERHGAPHEAPQHWDAAEQALRGARELFDQRRFADALAGLRASIAAYATFEQEVDDARRRRREEEEEREAQRRRKQQEEKEEQEAQARELERRRREAEAAEAERQRRDAEAKEADSRRREAEAKEAERRKREAEAKEAERRKQEAEAAEAARRKREAEAKETERRKREAEAKEAERRKREAEQREAEQRRREAEAKEVERRRRELEAREAELRKREAEAKEVERRRREIEEREAELRRREADAKRQREKQEQKERERQQKKEQQKAGASPSIPAEEAATVYGGVPVRDTTAGLEDRTIVGGPAPLEQPAPVAAPIWKNPVVAGAAGLAGVGLVVAVVLFGRSASEAPLPPTSPGEPAQVEPTKQVVPEPTPKVDDSERLRQEAERERLATEERDRAAAAERERLANEQRERDAVAEKERLATAERERLANEERERVAKQERERIAKEERERIAREERQRIVDEERKRAAADERERLAKEQRDRAVAAERELAAKQKADADKAKADARAAAQQEKTKALQNQLDQLATETGSRRREALMSGAGQFAGDLFKEGDAQKEKASKLADKGELAAAVGAYQSAVKLYQQATGVAQNAAKAEQPKPAKPKRPTTGPAF